MSQGYVYILSNPYMPGVFKVGMTTLDPHIRAAQLNTTGVPAPFEVEHSRFFPNCAQAEYFLHREYEDCRVSSGREFFRAELEDLAASLHSIADHEASKMLETLAPNLTPVSKIYGVLANRIKQRSLELRLTEEQFVCALLVADDATIKSLAIKAHFIMDKIHAKAIRDSALVVANG